MLENQMQNATAADVPQEADNEINLTPMLDVVIQADKRSFNDTLVQVMNASREAGIYEISIAVEKDE